MRELTELLHAGYWGKLTTPRSLQTLAGLSTAQAAALCLVAQQTYRRWGRDRSVNPTALRLLAIQAGYVPWPGWGGWEMHNGYLFPPGFNKGGLAPGDIMRVPFLYQLLREYRRQLGQDQIELSLAPDRRQRKKVAL